MLAVVGPDDASEVLLAGRSLAGRAPVVAILPISDDRAIERAAELGARACYALDTPLDRLRAMLIAVLGDQLVRPPV